jgi:O-antigen ligase
MASVLAADPRVQPAVLPLTGDVGDRPAASGNSLGFGLFIVANVTLFIRPGEIIPELIGWPIFLVLGLLCLAVSLPQVLRQLSSRSLRETPITVCVLGLLAAVVVSHLVNLSLEGAGEWGVEFLKMVVYYLLLVGLVDSPARLRRFLGWLAILTAALTLLAVLEFHGVITLPNLKPLKDSLYDPTTGRDITIRRLQSTGIFHDPNDLCVMLAVGILLSLYRLAERRAGPRRFLWLGPLLLCGYALTLTQSRSGFLALLAGVLAYLVSRFGRKKTMFLATAVVPALFLMVGGRQTNLSTGVTTGQTRIQIWSDGIMLFREQPLFGVGVDNYDRTIGHVAHNSYLQAFTELGLFGGILFLGAFYVAVVSLYGLGSEGRQIVDPELRRLHPFLLACTAAWAGGMLFLTLCYIMPTYTILGLATVFPQTATTEPPLPRMRFDGRLVKRMIVASGIFLMVLYVFVRVFIHW